MRVVSASSRFSGRRETVAVLLLVFIAPRAALAGDPPAASTQPSLVRYKDVAQRIIDATLEQNDAYKKLEELCDDIGNRLSGAESLDRAVIWAVATLKRDGQESVRAEPVMVPKWVRGRESLEIVRPQKLTLPMLGLGGSVGTPADGLTATIISVASQEELTALGDEKVRGNIVLFNHPMPSFDPEKGTGYGPTVRYRTNGAVWAAEHGAVAALVRSVTARSLRSPHTGAMHYGDAEPKIPAAAITTEDAERITRMQARGIPVFVTLKMEAHSEGDVRSANVIAELRGREKPDEIVVMGGHIDSWDVGQGAQDDGAGCAITMEALHVLRRLKLTPRRTIRVVLWTNEENGLAGARTYAKEHEGEVEKHVAAIESDSGAFAPRGFSVGHKDAEREKRAVAQLADIIKLLEPLGSLKATGSGGGADVGPLKDLGVLVLGHEVDNATYFDYHHTHADTLDKIDPQELSKNVAAMAVVAYVLAEMEGQLGE